MAKGTFDQTAIKELKVSDMMMISEKDCIIVKKISFKDKKYIDVRKYYTTDKGEWAPTSKGIWIPVEDLDNKTFAKDLAATIIQFSEEEK